MTLQPGPLVVEGRSFPPHGYLSPLDQHPGEDRPPTGLRGGVVTDPEIVAEIATRVRYYVGGWWRPALALRSVEALRAWTEAQR
ncbi:hypothetical protein [Pseudonocardia dioxanivorans]|jgi:hypothetical protein|uniref:hypothetical protein n=1 Tax=Pseudonocardia dioxanivorans TaxID=240495 RepID=UPI000CD1B33C|nr:hypothetical protein [Pseudonocardia dioxanivorans]